MPSPKYGFCVISLLTGIYAEEWGERFGEPEVADDFKESVFSGHNRTDVHRNSQQLDSTHQTCANSSQVRAQHGRREVDKKSPLS